MALAAALVLAACGSDSDSGQSADTTTTTTGPTTTTTEAMTDGAVVTTSESGLGTILVDAEGTTLYLFTPDDGGESTCYDACAVNWPPLIGEPQAGDGVDPSLIGSVTRDDGAQQVTYDGWPLYYFAADAAPGDTNGQGVNGIWWVVSPDGEAIGPDASSATTDAPDDSSFEY